MIEKFKNLFKKQEQPAPVAVTKSPKEPRVPRERKPKQQIKTAKELANERNEPYVAILSVELDTENIGNGAFELDWNDKFIAGLVRAGYQTKPNEPENEIVDRWFADICRNVVLETYQQEIADPEKRSRIDRRNLGNGRTEIS